MVDKIKQTNKMIEETIKLMEEIAKPIANAIQEITKIEMKIFISSYMYDEKLNFSINIKPTIRNKRAKLYKNNNYMFANNIIEQIIIPNELKNSLLFSISCWLPITKEEAAEIEKRLIQLKDSKLT